MYLLKIKINTYAVWKKERTKAYNCLHLQIHLHVLPENVILDFEWTKKSNRGKRITKTAFGNDSLTPEFDYLTYFVVLFLNAMFACCL